MLTGGGPMSKVAEKQLVVDEISQKFNESESAVLVDYRGLSVAEVTALRKRTTR